MDELSIEEANQVIANKEHSLNGKYWGNDKATVDAVNRALEAAHPGDFDAGGGLGLAIEKQLADWNQSEQQVDKPLTPEEIEIENNRAVGELRVAFGNEFESRFQTTREISHAIHEHADENIRNLGRQATEILAASEIGQVGAARLIDALITAVREKVIKEMAEGK
jgi:hypothetical protein